MENTEESYESVDVAQQTDDIVNLELNQEPGSCDEEFAHTEQMVQEQDQQPIFPEENDPSIHLEASDEVEAPSVLPKQPDKDQEAQHHDVELPDTTLDRPSSTHEQKQSSLTLEDLHTMEQSTVDDLTEQTEPQNQQESSTELQQSTDQELQETEGSKTTPPTLVQGAQLFANEQNANYKNVVLNDSGLEKTVNPDISKATATVKVMLVPDGQVVTLAFSIGYTVEELKKYFAPQLKVPEAVICIMFEGRVVEDRETLVDLGVTPHGTIQLEMLSQDPENYPIKAMKLQHEYSLPDVITVRVQTDKETFQDLVVEIERLNYRKPYLGGYRNKITGHIFHHAGTQTVPKKRPERGVEVYCRDTQTVAQKNKIQQSRNDMATQMTKPGCYVSNESDKLLEPKTYVTAEEFHAARLNAVIVIQTYFRRFRAKRLVESLKEEKRLKLEWEEKEELRKKEEREDRLRKDYERRMNPKTKEDFELLYHALEAWRKEQLENINQTYIGAERKAALCALLEQETQLIASIGRHKIDVNEDNQQKAIQSLLQKCSEPKKWKSFDGKITEMDTQYTIRARELCEIYNSINTKYFSKDERLDALLTLKLTVKEHDCKLTQEIVELIDREADLLMRGVKDSNLAGLRKRISTLFLQYIRIPTFNPEVARLLKVPQDSNVLRKNIHFCPSCKNYLPSTEYTLSANARTVGRCRKCSKLDNEARQREEFSKYKILFNHIRKSESEYDDGARIAFLLQQQDLQYLVENIWASQSALSACDDLYNLVMVRWDKYFEWSPWNCILLTKDEAASHLKLVNAEQAYGIVFIHKIKHRHTLAKNHFSQIPEMAPFLRGETSNHVST
ncbi:IQ and ubiquitin-like domain-containing protein [Bombina bombina]|uniref:IQ and ubiquitin-like domain-containing protein n=1 Tax=Bombina bombina TaxID=8345 RepID=UPI00235B2045|nr:IQ and ubiquitin-like domain-containing protein [Bombina bombina]